MAGTELHLWLAFDPETCRVAAQSREWADGDFPRGRRGVDWPRRECDVDPAVWDKLLAGDLPPAEQDELHRQWWNSAGPVDGPQWPEADPWHV